jgi:hypothetical protein
MNGESERIWKNWTLAYRNLPGGTEYNHENENQNGLCPGQESKRAPPEEESGMLPLTNPFVNYFSAHFCVLSSLCKCYISLRNTTTVPEAP